jgi:hypothetical protein
LYTIASIADSQSVGVFWTHWFAFYISLKNKTRMERPRNSNKARTNANQQIVNINLGELLSKTHAKKTEKPATPPKAMPPKREKSLARELRSAAAKFEAAKDKAEASGVVIPQGMRTIPDHLQDAQSEAGIRQLVSHLNTGAAQIRSLLPARQRVGDFGLRPTATPPASTTSRRPTNSSESATNSGQTEIPPDQIPMLREVRAAIKAVRDFTTEAESIGEDAIQAIPLIQKGTQRSAELVALLDESADVGQKQNAQDALDDAEVMLGKLVSVVRSSEKALRDAETILESVQELGTALEIIRQQFEDEELTSDEAIVAVAAIKKMAIRYLPFSRNKRINENTRKDIAAVMEEIERFEVAASEENRGPYEMAVGQYINRLNATLALWDDYLANNPELSSTRQAGKLLEELQERLTLMQVARDEKDSEEVIRLMNQPLISLNVPSSTQNYEKIVIGLYTNRGNSVDFRTDPADYSWRPVEDGFKVYRGQNRLGGERILDENGLEMSANNVKCNLGFRPTDRRGLDACVMIPGVNFAPPQQPPSGANRADLQEYIDRLEDWGNANRQFLPIAQKQMLSGQLQNARELLEFAASQPAPEGSAGGDVGPGGGEVEEGWPEPLPQMPADDDTLKAWQQFRRETIAYMNDNDDRYNDAQFEQLQARVNTAEAKINAILDARSSEPTSVPNTDAPPALPPQLNELGGNDWLEWSLGLP